MHQFAYDGINQLISASHPLASNLPAQESFGYDAAGNRESPLNSNDYDYDKNNQITRSPVISNYQFDNSGNLIQRGSNETFSYNIENQLTRYNNTTTGVVANYVYDPFGRRIKKEATQNSATTTTYYLWDNNDIIAEYGAVGSRIKHYSYAGSRYLPLHMEDTTGEYHVHGDHLGAPTILTNQTGDIIDAVTGGEFTQDQLNNLSDLTVRTLNPVLFSPTILDAIGLTSVDITTNPIVLTNGQHKTLQKIFDKILKNKLDGKQLTDVGRLLAERAKKLLEDSIKEGTCVIK